MRKIKQEFNWYCDVVGFVEKCGDIEVIFACNELVLHGFVENKELFQITDKWALNRYKSSEGFDSEIPRNFDLNSITCIAALDEFYPRTIYLQEKLSSLHDDVKLLEQEIKELNEKYGEAEYE